MSLLFGNLEIFGMMKNIGILGAMAEEIDEVKALLTEKTIVKIANREFVVGKIGSARCVVAFSKWGKVAATITATLLIQEFAVTDLVFIGTAGALADGLKVGDIVISKRLVQHDLDARPMDAVLTAESVKSKNIKGFDNQTKF